MVLGFVVAPLATAQAVRWVWSRHLLIAPPSYHGGFRILWTPALLGACAVPSAIGVLAVLVYRYRPGVWWRLVLIACGPVVLISLIHVATTVAALGILAVAMALVALAARILTYPLASDVLGSRQTVHVRTRGPRRLRLLHDRLELSDPDGTWSFAYRDCESVAADEIHALNSPAVTTRGFFDLASGPAIRVAGHGNDWLVPVVDAEAARSIVDARVRAGRAREPVSVYDRWFEATALAAGGCRTLLVALATAAMAAIDVGFVATRGPWPYVLGVAVLPGVSALAFVRYIRAMRRYIVQPDVRPAARIRPNRSPSAPK
ncbi:hypothetical protein ACFYO1_02055 [Nocardia sp. NPDC006044]|uniref:hypothetical protein n=1 Tax=Nocardia sp. NPDC006044 TaxID=3364306 RepID=UPI0036CA8AE1